MGVNLAAVSRLEWDQSILAVFGEIKPRIAWIDIIGIDNADVDLAQLVPPNSHPRVGFQKRVDYLGNRLAILIATEPTGGFDLVKSEKLRDGIPALGYDDRRIATPCRKGRLPVGVLIDDHPELIWGSC